MGGNGYSADDNRSMQLNDNNDRYYSSRGIDRDDDYSEEECDSYTGMRSASKFKGYISLEDWLPYFKVWIQNLKISSDQRDAFSGFNYWNEDHKRLWFYYRTRALIDYCTDNDLSWTVLTNGFLFEYRVQDWLNFAFSGGNIMAVNKIIYGNNGLEFPANAEELFLSRIVSGEE